MFNIFKNLFKGYLCLPPKLCKNCGKYTFPDNMGYCRHCDSKLD